MPSFEDIIINIAGTSEDYFALGFTGITFYHGFTDPNVLGPTPAPVGLRDGDCYYRTDPANLEVYMYQAIGTTWLKIATAGVAAGVTSFNTRTGVVTAAASDYDADEIDYDNTTSGIVATNVQDAIDAIDLAIDSIGGPFLLLAGGTMDPGAHITMGAGGQILGDGSAPAGAPAFSFASDPTSGMYLDPTPITGGLAFSESGTPRLVMRPDGILEVKLLGYEGSLANDNDIPNKKYVDDEIAAAAGGIINVAYDVNFHQKGDLASFGPSTLIGQVLFTRDVAFDIGTIDAQAKCRILPTNATVDYTIEKNGTQFGTVQFVFGSDTGTVTTSSAETFNPGDILTLTSPSVTDPTISDVSVTLVGCAEVISCTP